MAGSANPVKVAEALRKIEITSGPAGPPGYYGVRFNEYGWNELAKAVMVEWFPGGKLVTVYASGRDGPHPELAKAEPLIPPPWGKG